MSTEKTTDVEIDYYVYAPETFSVDYDGDDELFYEYHRDMKHEHFVDSIIGELDESKTTDEFEGYVTIIVEELLTSRHSFTLQQIHRATEEYLENDKVIFPVLQPAFIPYEDEHTEKLQQSIENLYGSNY